MNTLHDDVLYCILQYLYSIKDIYNIHLISKKYYCLFQVNHIWKHYVNSEYTDMVSPNDLQYKKMYKKCYMIKRLSKFSVKEIKDEYGNYYLQPISIPTDCASP